MKQLLPFYTKMDKAIREISPDFILFFENMPFPDFLPLFGGLILGGFTETPNAENRNKVYNVHSYCCNSGADTCGSGAEPTLEYSRTRCPKYHKKKIQKHMKEIKKLSTPWIISEFGNCFDGEICYNEITSVVKNAEEHFISWAYWVDLGIPKQTNTTEHIPNAGLYYSDGTIQEVKEMTLSRAYVQSYQGTPQEFHFLNNSTDYETVFEWSSTVQAPTRIYFNKNFFYNNGYNIRVENSVGKEVDYIFTEVDENRGDIKIIDEEKYFGQKIKIIFTGK